MRSDSRSARTSSPPAVRPLSGAKLIKLGFLLLAIPMLALRGAPAGAVVVVAICLISLGQDLRLEILMNRDLHRKAAREAARAQRRERRRERALKEYETKMQRRNRLAAERARDQAVRAAQEAKSVAARSKSAADRIERETQLQETATRLIAMEDWELRAVVTEVLQARGIAVCDPQGTTAPPVTDPEPKRTTAVLQIVPALDQARVADLESLEAWRRDTGSAEAFLMARVGFTQATVRLAQQFPVTLVDPYLLAGWKHRKS